MKTDLGLHCLLMPICPKTYHNDLKFSDILSFRTDTTLQTVQTQIRLLLRISLIRVYTVCHCVCIFWTHYSMVEPNSSNIRIFTATFSSVPIFIILTVGFLQQYSLPVPPTIVMVIRSISCLSLVLCCRNGL